MVAALVLAAPAAGAITGAYWHDDGVVLAQGSNANVVGFWQAMLCSNIPALNVDGIFGPITKGRTQGFQTDVAGVTPDGIVGSNTWLYTEFATYDNGTQYRLSGDGYYWSYYGGGASAASFFWNPAYFNDTWLWQAGWGGSGPWYDTSPTTNSILPAWYC